ncbi:outer membrane chaperone Skp [Rhodovulum sulfidophilum]|uniref:Outer membrane chaperone Skp n=1 Tax=Rhodovulum sulfidophilum TaxID=35806 RepID=A0A0D6B3I0_RHOSU|nr:outer membrane chaperone Skp [Rhodovulum sulfidophilum]
MRRSLTAPVLAAMLGLAASGASAQEGRTVFVSPILTLDQDRLFEDSKAGQAVDEQLEAATAALAAENRRIEAELVAEERALTERRATLPPDQFRPLAEAFDHKVETIRATQDRKARELGQQREEKRQDFFRKALPLLAGIVRERGAVAVLARDAVVLSAGQVDITDEAIKLLDERVVFTPDDGPSPDAPATGGEPSSVPAPETGGALLRPMPAPAPPRGATEGGD